MARTKKTNAKSVSAIKSVEIMVPLGVCLIVDEDLRVRPGESEKDVKKRLEATGDWMATRHKDAILNLFRTAFPGQLVSDWMDVGTAYLGMTSTGYAGKLPKDTSDPSELFTKSPPVDAPPVEPESDLASKTVAELRELCKGAGLKTQGTKTNLIARLIR